MLRDPQMLRNQDGEELGKGVYVDGRPIVLGGIWGGCCSPSLYLLKNKEREEEGNKERLLAFHRVLRHCSVP